MWVLSRKRLAYEWYLIRRANVKLDGYHLVDINLLAGK